MYESLIHVARCIFTWCATEGLSTTRSSFEILQSEVSSTGRPEGRTVKNQFLLFWNVFSFSSLKKYIVELKALITTPPIANKFFHFRIRRKQASRFWSGEKAVVRKYSLPLTLAEKVLRQVFVLSPSCSSWAPIFPWVLLPVALPHRNFRKLGFCPPGSCYFRC